jgi:hypothetical protein
VVFAEMEGSDDMIRSVLSQMAERVGARAEAPAGPIEARGLLGGATVSESLALLPGPAGVPPAKRRGKGKLKHAPPPKAEASGMRFEQIRAAEELRGEIAVLLKKRPLTSREIIDATRREAGQIYAALSMLRKEGVVRTVEDESDGQRKNYLAA